MTIDPTYIPPPDDDAIPGTESQVICGTIIPVEGACAFLFVRVVPLINRMCKPLDKARTNG